jgi:hypothetical protein
MASGNRRKDGRQVGSSPVTHQKKGDLDVGGVVDPDALTLGKGPAGRRRERNVIYAVPRSRETRSGGSASCWRFSAKTNTSQQGASAPRPRFASPRAGRCGTGANLPADTPPRPGWASVVGVSFPRLRVRVNVRRWTERNTRPAVEATVLLQPVLGSPLRRRRLARRGYQNAIERGGALDTFPASTERRPPPEFEVRRNQFSRCI